MKTSKWTSFFFIVLLLTSCSSPKARADQSTVIPPTQTTPFLDFDHPRLHEIAGNKPLVIDEIVRTRRTQEPSYAAIIVETGDPLERQKMFIFKLEKSGAVLIYESDANYYMSFNILSDQPNWLIENVNYYYYRAIVGGIARFGADRLEVPYKVSNGGNCYDCSEMKVVGITENGAAKDITPHAGFTSKAFTDINGQEKFVIVATHYYEGNYGASVHTASPYAFRIYEWDGDAYVDVSKDKKEFYDVKTAELTNRLQATYDHPLNSLIAMPILADIFFNYESSGRVEYGWEQIQELGDLSHWDIQNTQSEETRTYHDVFDKLEQRKNEDLATTVP